MRVRPRARACVFEEHMDGRGRDLAALLINAPISWGRKGQLGTRFSSVNADTRLCFISDQQERVSLTWSLVVWLHL